MKTSNFKKTNKNQQTANAPLSASDIEAMGLENYFAHRRAVRDSELAEIRELRSACVQRIRIRNLSKAWEANRQQASLPLSLLEKKKLARKEATRYQKVVTPKADSQRDLQFVIAGLRELVDSGVSVRLTERGRLTLEKLNDSLPEESIGFISDCAATVAEWMGSYRPHSTCPRNARPMLIAGEEFKVRCSSCYRGLRRRKAS